jgi:hypothetical protein
MENTWSTMQKVLGRTKLEEQKDRRIDKNMMNKY